MLSADYVSMMSSRWDTVLENRIRAAMEYGKQEIVVDFTDGIFRLFNTEERQLRLKAYLRSLGYIVILEVDESMRINGTVTIGWDFNDTDPFDLNYLSQETNHWVNNVENK